MSTPTLFRRLFIAQLMGALALLLVVGALFYVERNRTIARLVAERWAPALRGAAGLGAVGGASATLPAASAVLVAEARPSNAMRPNRWAPRIVILRETLRAGGLPVDDIVFAPGRLRPLTWVAVALPDGRVRWLGFDDDVVETHVLGRTLAALVLGLAAVALASALVARRLARPLEELRRRIAAHDGAAVAAAGAGATTSTAEIEAIDDAWRTLRARLAQQESERALLLAGVSHDLRSPLARIRMAAELLPESPELAPRRSSIVRNVDVADRLIASFLDYVRASEAALDAEVDLVALARRQLELRDEPPGTLSLSAPASLRVPRASEMLLERLLANLLDNALRHGRPPVRLHLQAQAGHALIDVVDHGPGIEPAARDHVTQAFARADTSRGTPGTGLGLAVVAQVVRRMGGELGFDRLEGAHRVRVRLPLR